MREAAEEKKPTPNGTRLLLFASYTMTYKYF